MLVFPFMFNPFSSLLSLFVPFLLIFLGIRFIRRIFFSASRDVDRIYGIRRREIPLDDIGTRTEYRPPPPTVSQSDIFQLARKLKGRITLSDIVIETGVTLKEAETIIEAMIDGSHVTMEVRDNGRVVYEFPEIIDRFGEPDAGASSK